MTQKLTPEVPISVTLHQLQPVDHCEANYLVAFTIQFGLMLAPYLGATMVNLYHRSALGLGLPI